jgi:TLC domain
VFAVFAVTFYGTRLVLLPRIAYALHVDAFKVMTEDATYNDWASNFETSFKHLAFFSLLIDILILLHCFWFCLILKMIYREVFLGKKISEEEDIREAKT